MKVANSLRQSIYEKILESGSSTADYFGFPTKEDGLFLQQDPDEFANFVHYMATRIGSANLTIDIGIASGGQTKFLRDYFSCQRTIIVDDGNHEMFHHWQRIKSQVKSEIILEMIASSHSRIVKEKLKHFTDSVDFAYVDGDHSYKGLKQDIMLVAPLLKVGGIMALHDTQAVPDCRRVFLELLSSNQFVLLQTFNSRFGISLWLKINKKRRYIWPMFKFALGRI